MTSENMSFSTYAEMPRNSKDSILNSESKHQDIDHVITPGKLLLQNRFIPNNVGIVQAIDSYQNPRNKIHQMTCDTACKRNINKTESDRKISKLNNN